MSQPPFMQLYVADYLGDTQHLTTEQHGAYLLILMAMWRAGGALPSDPAKLARVARVSPRRWHLIAHDVMAFFDAEGDQITQKRLVEEYQKATAISEKRSVSGKRGGDAKALKTKQSTLANAKQLLKHSQISETIKKEGSLREPRARAASTQGSFLPADWRPSPEDWAVGVRETGNEALAERELARFRDFWGGKPGAAGRKRDWPATWRNWVRKAADDNRKNQHGQRTSSADTALAGLARAARKLSGLDQPGPRGPPASGDDDFGGPATGFAGPGGTISLFPATRFRA